MNLATLPKAVSKSRKRVGRGYGSGRGGHTSGRGNKGQKSRTKIRLFFEGTKFKKSLIKRLPLLRGKSKLRSIGKKAVAVNLKYLNLFKKDEVVNFKTLQDKGILAKNLAPKAVVKILGEGEVSVPLVVETLVSKGAKVKILKAGGEVKEASEGK